AIKAVMRANLRFLRRRRRESEVDVGRVTNELKLLKQLKYEGKRSLESKRSDGCELRSTYFLHARFAAVKALLILGNQSFSDMFTSYSHVPLFRLLARA